MAGPAYLNELDSGEGVQIETLSGGRFDGSYFTYQHLKVMQLNIRSINRNFDEFLVLINSFNFAFDVIVLTETWYSDSVGRIFNIPNYEVFFSPTKKLTKMMAWQFSQGRVSER